MGMTTKEFLLFVQHKIQNQPGRSIKSLYEEAEKYHQEIYDRRKYSGYDSFRNVKKRHKWVSDKKIEWRSAELKII